MRALTAARRHLAGQLSPLTSSHLPTAPPPTTTCLHGSLCTPVQRPRCVSGLHPPRGLASTRRRIEFVILRIGRSSPVASHPVSRRMQFPSTTGLWFTLTWTSTMLIRRPRGRTRSGLCPRKKQSRSATCPRKGRVRGRIRGQSPLLQRLALAFCSVPADQSPPRSINAARRSRSSRLNGPAAPVASSR